MRSNANLKSNNFFNEYAISLEIEHTSETNEEIWVYSYIKRLFDIFFSILGLVITIPIIVVTGIVIKLESEGPIFYTQERVGLYGKYFHVIKLRSMRINAEKNGAQWAKKNDPRVTKVGSFIRKTRIDELPQLWNVLIGDMSLVGPRPERPLFTAQFNDEIPGFVERLKVRPGLTGWAQVNGGYDLTPKQKFNLDLFYIDHSSFIFDIVIILKTIKIIITREGAR